MPLDLVQWPAAALGILGAWLVGSASTRTRWIAFLVWMVSNVLWVSWAIAGGTWGLLAMQSAFLVTSARGLVTHSRLLRAERAARS